MKQYRMWVKEKDGSELAWSEKHTSFSGTTLEEFETEAKAMIKSFNATLYPGEKPRELVRVELIEDVPKEIPHTWRKVNLVTIMDDRSSYDKYKCVVCGVTAKRYGLGSIERDRKFRARKYEFCKE